MWKELHFWLFGACSCAPVSSALKSSISSASTITMAFTATTTSVVVSSYCLGWFIVVFLGLSCVGTINFSLFIVNVEGNGILATQVIQSGYSSLTSLSLVQYFAGYGLPYQSRRCMSLSNLSLLSYRFTIKSELLSSLLVCPMYSHIGFGLLCTF
jgi:hypothetical protein